MTNSTTNPSAASTNPASPQSGKPTNTDQFSAMLLGEVGVVLFLAAAMAAVVVVSWLRARRAKKTEIDKNLGESDALLKESGAQKDKTLDPYGSLDTATHSSTQEHRGMHQQEPVFEV